MAGFLLHATEAVSKTPARAAELHGLGLREQQTGRVDEAIAWLQAAVDAEPEAAIYRMNLGNALQMSGRLEEAVAAYEKALELRPELAAAWSNLGVALLGLGRLEEAVRAQERAAALCPGSAQIEDNRGNALQAVGRLEEAIACHERSLRLAGGKAQAGKQHAGKAERLGNLGLALAAAGRWGEAMSRFEEALRVDPENARIQLARAQLELLLGNFREGWGDYEWRKRVRRAPTPAGRAWRGEALAAGESLLLYAEEGLGDTIQFLRYLPAVRDRAGASAQIVIQVQEPLRRLAAALGPRVVGEEEPLPVCDWHCAWMSLPWALGESGARAASRYLHAPEEAVDRIGKLAEGQGWVRHGNGHENRGEKRALQVGLVWAGNRAHVRDRFRSMELRSLEGLLEVEGVRFHSLQMGEAGDSEGNWEAGAKGKRLVDWRAAIGDMADTAAVIERLDLVIGVDTAVVHLAGALGKRVWTMLPFWPDWRWGLGREDCAWYPSMRLFRQGRPGEWAGVIDAVTAALADEVAQAGFRSPVSSGRPGTVGAAAPAFAPGARPGAPVWMPCKVCGEASGLFGLVDFHKSCEEARGKKLPLSGFAVYYRRCGRCGFVFSSEFDGWTEEEFKRYIYNADYGLVDPDYAEARPAGNARLVAESFAEARETLRILDYGGGAGLLAARLRERGFQAETYDPFSEFRELPEGRFGLVTCFEVLEHVPWPRQTARAMAELVEEGGAILFSTLVQPAEFARVGLGWWYAAPRNGHISLYSTAALARLFGELGMKVASFSESLHISYRTVPLFAAHLGLPE